MTTTLTTTRRPALIAAASLAGGAILANVAFIALGATRAAAAPTQGSDPKVSTSGSYPEGPVPETSMQRTAAPTPAPST